MSAAAATRKRRLQVDFDEVDWLDSRPFHPRSDADTLEDLRRALTMKVYRYRSTGGCKRFVVRSVPSQHVVILFRIE